MKFEIDSSDIIFNGKDLKSFFAVINEACKIHEINYFVVGTFARDLVLENIFKHPTGITTKDIDVAITIDLWDKYALFVEHLKSQYQFTSGKNLHEYISPEGIYMDLIPYGAIESDRTISFPPKFELEMNMLGFQEIFDSTLHISLDKTIDIKVASIEGIAILKLIAWNDREPAAISEKHTRDIGIIINAYYDALVNEFAPIFQDLFDDEEFDPIVCGARALGRRIKQLSKPSKALCSELERVFTYITSDDDNSLFINQLSLSDITYRKYPFTLRIIKSLIQGFREH